MDQNAGNITATGAERQKLFGKDFTLMVIGQVISLFGNNILRFALPLYILQVSGSPALFSIVSATSFIPMIIMSPLGGIVADRLNKQRIMVFLDFLTAGLIFVFMLANGQVALVPLVIVFLMLLYGIQGAYTPAVQASLPILAKGENLVPANAVVNLVQSLSGLVGPVLGGMLYAAYGITPILQVSCACFAFSAVLELFIKIPHKKQKLTGNILNTVKDDMRSSFKFMIKDNPIMVKVVGIIVCINMFLSAMMVIGIPVVITQNLGLTETHYGITEGVMAAGGLAGGICAGVFGNKINIRRVHLLLLICALSIFPIVATLLVAAPAMVSYIIITVIGFVAMAASSLFSIQMLAFVQQNTPPELVGKVISLLMALSMCAMPLGQLIYGFLFENIGHISWLIIFGGMVASLATALFSKAVFGKLQLGESHAV